MFFKNIPQADDKIFDDIPTLKTASKGLVSSGLIAFAVLFLGCGLWMFFASIQGAVIASGTVSVLGKPKTIQHLDGASLPKFWLKMVRLWMPEMCWFALTMRCSKQILIYIKIDFVRP